MATNSDNTDYQSTEDTEQDPFQDSKEKPYMSGATEDTEQGPFEDFEKKFKSSEETEEEKKRKASFGYKFNKGYSKVKETVGKGASAVTGKTKAASKFIHDWRQENEQLRAAKRADDLQKLNDIVTKNKEIDEVRKLRAEAFKGSSLGRFIATTGGDISKIAGERKVIGKTRTGRLIFEKKLPGEQSRIRDPFTQFQGASALSSGGGLAWESQASEPVGLGMGIGNPFISQPASQMNYSPPQRAYNPPTQSAQPQNRPMDKAERLKAYRREYYREYNWKLRHPGQEYPGRIQQRSSGQEYTPSPSPSPQPQPIMGFGQSMPQPQQFAPYGADPLSDFVMRNPDHPLLRGETPQRRQQGPPWNGGW